MSKNENEICRSPPGGVNSFTWPKLTTANDKVKFMEGGFFTLVLTFFLNIFYSRIVDSVFCCMFTPSQRSDTKTNTKMENLMNVLDQFEMKFNEGQKICFSEFVGEEHEGKNFGSMLNLSGLSDHMGQIADWNISRECEWLFDDGWFHLKINRDLITEEFIKQIDFD